MIARNALLLALDPGQVLHVQGLAPDPWQRDLLHSTDRQVLLNCARQSGKSTTVAALALHTGLFLDGSLVLILSPSLRQSGELFRKVVAAYEAMHRPVPATAMSQARLELVNGSRLVCLPAREETIRGFSGPRLLLIDEAARVPDDLYRAVRPMLAVSRGRILCLSTPFGRRGYFYEEWQHGGEAWKRVCISAADCPRITPEFLNRERQSLGASWVAQEYLCSFESLEGLVYPDFEAQTAYEPEEHGEPGVSATGVPTGKRVGGIDWGFRNPFAALWGCLDADDVLTITGERYLRETPLHEHGKLLPRNVTWYADPAGAQEITAFRQAGFTVRKGHNEIRPGIAAVHARLQTGRLKVIAQHCPNLLAEARLYRYPTRQDGQADSENPVDENNHALAALRYLVATLDAAFLARFRRSAASGGCEPPGNDLAATDVTGGSTPPARQQKPWLRLDNDALWS